MLGVCSPGGRFLRIAPLNIINDFDLVLNLITEIFSPGGYLVKFKLNPLTPAQEDSLCTHPVRSGRLVARELQLIWYSNKKHESTERADMW